jgi:iron complex outermembrane receptor protein
VLSGVLNPFGAQTAAGAAYLSSISEDGQVIRDTTSSFDAVDFSASHDLMELAGGNMAMNLGAVFHHDAMQDVSPANNINNPYNGRQPYDVSASRNISSLFGELDAPITKQIDLDFGIRADDYSDIGASVNPKLSIRYQPTKTLVLRASYNTGFRAPSLIDMYGYRLPEATTTTSAKWDDPLLCPGTGAPGTGKITPAALAAGLTSGEVCNIKQPVQTGSNPNLLPEKSKNFTAGFVLEPIKDLTLTVDYWRIQLTNTLGSLSETAIFENPALYAANFVRNPSGLLAYVSEDTQNLGGTITSGEDLEVLYKLPQTSLGKFTFDLRGTYTNQYEQQVLPNGPWTQNVGQFGGVTLGTYSSNPLLTFRWKHNAMLSWVKGDWNTVLSENFQTGYHDQNTAVTSQFYRDISPYSVVNLTTSYTGIKNVTLSGGVNNLFNVRPPLTNSQSATGLLLDYASAVGRAYILTATYKFF